MVLAVPLRQMTEKMGNRIECRHLLRVDVCLNVRLRILTLADVLAHGLQHDAVQGQLCQRTKQRFLALRGLGGKLQLAVQHVAAKQVTVVQKQLCGERSHLQGIRSLALNK